MSEMARKQLDKRLNRLPPASEFARPPRGWLRAIREALGMTTGQFGKRLGVSQSRSSAIERAEVDGSITLASLQRAAEALDCSLIYALVPRQPLQAMIMESARAAAAEKLLRIDQTMRLENQAVSERELEDERERLARDLAEHPRRLWARP